MESLLINEANRQGKNYGTFYFIGLFVSFFVGQLIGVIPLLSLAILKGNFNIAAITDPVAMGVDNNLFFALMMLPFVFSFLLLALYVKWVHKRPALTIITPFNKLNWAKLWFGFFVWLGLMAVMEGVNYFLDPDNYILQFQPKKFFILLLISFPLLLIQTAFEEVMFRGYIMQWMGRYFPYRIVPLLITGLAFGLMHIMNPEVGEFGYQVMVDYISIGLILGLVTLLSDSLELAIGLHFANNLFLSLFFTFDSSVLQTDAVFKIKEMQFSTGSQMYSILLLIIFMFIVRAKYSLKPLSFLFQKDDWKVGIKQQNETVDDDE